MSADCIHEHQSTNEGRFSLHREVFDPRPGRSAMTPIFHRYSLYLITTNVLPRAAVLVYLSSQVYLRISKHVECQPLAGPKHRSDNRSPWRYGDGYGRRESVRAPCIFRCNYIAETFLLEASETGSGIQHMQPIPDISFMRKPEAGNHWVSRLR